MMDTLLLPFQFPFMQNAFWIALILAVPTALLSCFLVLKGWALMGDAASHATVPGVVLAYILGWPFLIGGFLAAMICVMATGYLAGNSRVKQDTVMGVVFSGMFALGVVMYTAVDSDIHLDHILYGNMLGVSGQDLIVSGLISVSVTLALALKWRDLLLHSFDPIQARASGLRTGVLHYGLLMILSAVIVATLSSAGLILAIGLIITPGAIAFLLTRQFVHMLWIAVLVCVVGMVGGVYASFWLNSAPAPTIILILTAVFLVAFIHRQITTRAASKQQVAAAG